MRASIGITALLWVQIVLYGFAGAARSEGLPPKQDGDRPVPNSPSPADRANPDDRSLSLDEYIQSGVPASDRPWSGEDMARAADRLMALARQDQGKLPRFASKRSGELFARITARKNLDLYRNRSLPLAARLPDALKYTESLNQMAKTYLSSFLKGATGGGEVIELLGAELRLMVVLMESIDEFLPTIPKDDPNYAVRMGGLRQMKEGLATVVMGSLQTLTEKDTYRADERLKLLGYMKETIPAILPRLLPGTRKEFLQRVLGMAKDANLRELQPALDDFTEGIRSGAD